MLKRLMEDQDLIFLIRDSEKVTTKVDTIDNV